MDSQSDVFIKHHGDPVDKDWVRTRLLFEISKSVPGLRSPEPLSLQSSSASIVYERLHGLRPLWNPAAAGAASYFALGGILADFHQAPLPPGIQDDLDRTPYPLHTLGIRENDIDLLDRELPTGMFHSDCWHGNIFLDPAGPFVLLDPIPQKWLFLDRYMVANSVIDLATLHMSLFICHPLARQIGFKVNKAKPLADALLDGYFSRIGSNQAIDALLRISRSLGYRHIDGYAKRLSGPVAIIKRRLATKIAMDVEQQHAWITQ